MQTIILDVQAGQVSAKRTRYDIGAETGVHVSVELLPDDADILPMTAIAKAGGAFRSLAIEPELYTDAHLVPQAE